MYKNLLALFLSIMIFGINSMCLSSLSHALTSESHNDHTHASTTVFLNCDTLNNIPTMSCCSNNHNHLVNAPVFSRLHNDQQEMPQLAKVTAGTPSDFSPQQYTYVAQAYTPPLLRIGIVVKKE